MALTLSISNKYFFQFILIALAGFLVSCSQEKITSVPIARKNPIKEIRQIKFGPEIDSNVFVDKTSEYGLAGVQAVHLYAVDVNNDGFTDLVTLEDFYSAPKFYLFNSKTHKFVLSQNPFDSLIRGSYLNFVDLDHDGIYDVIVGSLNQKTEMTQYPARIFKGIITKGILHFKELAPLPTKLLPTASIATIDFDLDGELDLYLANWFSYKDEFPLPVPDMLFKGAGFNFYDSSANLKAEYDFNKSDKIYTNATPTFGVSVCDIDKNGFPDLLTSNSNGYYNKLWLNLDGKNFVNYGNESGYSADDEGSEQSHDGGNSFFSLCGDYNNDGLIDVAVGNLAKNSDNESRDKSGILSGSTRSFPPKFIRSDFLRDDNKSNWSEGDRRGVWIDYNLDGLTDLIIDNSGFPPDSRLVLFQQAKDHSFSDKSKELGINLLNPSGTVTIDVNHDGVMDFISGQSKTRAQEFNNRIYLFENQTKRLGRGSVRFHLQGKKSNYFGISSSVWLATDKSTRFFNVEYNSGSLPSQNEEGAYFSFDKETPKNVMVRWSYANTDRLGRFVPEVVKYNLAKYKLKGSHHELNLCEDGRILPQKKKCY